MDLIAPLIILISALFLLLIPLAFIFVAFFPASIKTKRIVQIVATLMLALATVGVSLIWIMLAVVGAFQQLLSDMRHGQAEFDLPMVVYYSPWYIIALWIVNIGVFLIDMFSKNDSVKKRIVIILFGVVTVAVIYAAYWWPNAIAILLWNTFFPQTRRQDG